MSSRKNRKQGLQRVQPPTPNRPTSTAHLSLVSKNEYFSGPIPDPGTLDKYREVLPDAPNRILQMAEKQAAHRQSIERIVVIGAVTRSILGLIFGFIIGLAVLYASYKLIDAGHEISGGIFGGSTLVSVVGIFVYSYRKQAKELTEKKKQSQELTHPPDPDEA